LIGRHAAPTVVWRVIRASALMIALATGGAQAAGATAQESGAVAEVAKTSHRATPAPAARSGIDGRVQLLTKELDLDARQQVEVRKILVQQRAEVLQAWSDESLPAQMRVAGTRAIGNRTAERIRAILNDAQREKYIKPKPSLPDQAQPAGNLESWISAVGNPGHR